MAMLAKIRRMFYREHLSKREIARKTGLSRTTINRWLKDKAGEVEPKYAQRKAISKLDHYAETLSGWLKTNAQRSRRERRTVYSMYRELVATGYRGGYGRVAAFARRYRAEQSEQAAGQGFVPLKFALGEAFQFDWSTEYAFVGGLRRRLEVAHTKLCASRAFWLSAYYSQAHEMLFDAHTRAFAAFGGVPARGIYDNMKTAVDKVGRGKARNINARFEAMSSHYLFEPEFCNVAAGWEKGVVEKNVQDRRRQIWREAAEQRWADLAALNAWLEGQCRMIWAETAHPDWPELTIGDCLQDEAVKLMACPKAFDGYVEQPARVSATGLIYLQKNRYSVPSCHAHHIVSVRLYATHIEIVAEGQKVARHERSFERDQTLYDWRHYVELIEKKPGALRNGAPFETMPEALKELQRHLLKRSGGDRVMAQLLAAVPVHGLARILEATQAALALGKPSAEHVLYLLGQLKGEQQLRAPAVAAPLQLSAEPKADVDRYDRLREHPAIKAAILASPVLAMLMLGGAYVR